MKTTNTPNPLVPQGTLPDKLGKSHVRIAVFTIMAIHAVLLGALLLQGCKRTTTADAMASNMETNYPPPPTDTSAPPPIASIPGQDNTPPPPIRVAPQPNQFGQISGGPIPAPPSPLDARGPGVAAAGTPTEHVVVKNDVYSTIAKKYGTTVKALSWLRRND